jgi:isocitrate lyase
LQIEYTLARLGADRLWNLLNREKYVNALGAMRALVHNAGKRADNTLTRRVEAALDAGFANGSMPA